MSAQEVGNQVWNQPAVSSTGTQRLDQGSNAGISASRVNSLSFLSPWCELFFFSFRLRPAFCPCSLAWPVCQQTSLSHLALLPACFWVLSVLRLLCFIHVSVCWLLCRLELVLHMPRVCLLPWACTPRTSVLASAASPWAGFCQYCLVLQQLRSYS